MITSPTNPKIRYVRRLQDERRFREQERAFVVEGTRWLMELPAVHRRPLLVLYTESWAQSPAAVQTLATIAGPSLLVSEAAMRAASDTQTPAGVLAVVAIETIPLPPQPTLVLILDQIANPGNLGAILRTAAAAGVDGVLLAPGCVDAYNPKVVRGGMGAHLRLPIQAADWPVIGEMTAQMDRWLATVGGQLPYTSVDWRRPAALIIGSEAEGAGDQAQRLATGRLFIPMRAATESLNAAVAAGVILFEAVRQRET
ncbi:MAG: RNA methyltransferase [Chloroflexota bacterium]